MLKNVNKLGMVTQSACHALYWVWLVTSVTLVLNVVERQANSWSSWASQPSPMDEHHIL